MNEFISPSERHRLMTQKEQFDANVKKRQAQLDAMTPNELEQIKAKLVKDYGYDMKLENLKFDDYGNLR